LIFLKDQLNAYVATKTGSLSNVVKTSKVVDDSGKYAIDDGTIGATIISIEEDRVFKAQLPEYLPVNGRQVVLEPEIKLNLNVMFSANFKLYEAALKYITYVLTFFQSHPVFHSGEFPALDGRIKKLAVELQSPSYEQLNQIWAFIGGKHLPSVIYKVRLVALQDETPSAIQVPLSGISTNIHGSE